VRAVDEIARNLLTPAGSVSPAGPAGPESVATVLPPERGGHRRLIAQPGVYAGLFGRDEAADAAAAADSGAAPADPGPTVPAAGPRVEVTS
jgi:hypothetical protein